MFTRKSLVLKGTDESEKKAILSLECDGHETQGKLRLYNFPNEPLGIISLGIMFDGKVEKAGLTRTDSMLYTFACNMKNIPENFSCAVINFSQGQPSPILFGNSSVIKDKEEIFDSVIMALNHTNRMDDVEKILDEHGIELADDLKEEVEKNIDLYCDKCENCQYKSYYFSHKQIANKLNIENSESFEITGEEINNEKKKINKFYNEIKLQINDLFENNPSEKYLEKMLPNSKWVKVKVDEVGNFYVLGLIYEENELKYICYGVPGVYQEVPPRQLSGFPSWFPLDENSPDNFGYWLSYQDADSGESVKAIVV